MNNMVAYITKIETSALGHSQTEIYLELSNYKIGILAKI